MLIHAYTPIILIHSNESGPGVYARRVRQRGGPLTRPDAAHYPKQFPAVQPRRKGEIFAEILSEIFAEICPDAAHYPKQFPAVQPRREGEISAEIFAEMSAEIHV